MTPMNDPPLERRGRAIAYLRGLGALAAGLALALPAPAASMTPAATTPVAAMAAAGAVSPPASPLAPDTLTLNGIVVDSVTGAPLPATTIRVVELDREDLTHDDGTFHLTRIPEGTYTLVVEHLGYRTQRLRVDVGPAAARVTIRLQPSALDLPGLVVTATMGTRSREEALRPTQVLGGRELQRQLDVTLAETLEGEAGVSSASMGPAPARPVIRGLSGDRILVLEDGARVGDVSSASADHAVAVSAASAERIEVVRGPAALFYGSNALGGVVNVVREEIPVALPDHPTGTALLQGQTVNRGGAGSATYRRAVGALGVRGEVSGRWADDVRTALGLLPNTQLGSYGGSIGAAWIDDFGHAGAALRGYRSRYGIPPDPLTGHEHGVTVELERDALRTEADLLEVRGLGRLVASASVTRYDHREIEDSGELGTAFGQNTANAELVLRHEAFGPFDRGGFGVRAQWQGYASDTGRDEVRTDMLSGAVYGMQELDLDPLQLQVGLRFDLNRIVPETAEEVQGVDAEARTFHSISGSVAGLYEIAHGWRLGLSVSRAFRAPSPDELFSRGPHLAAYTYQVGNPDLQAENGLGVDLFLRVDRPGVSAEVAAFVNDINDYSYPLNTGIQRGPLFVYRHVNTDARFLGAEASARWRIAGDLVLDGDASYVRATNRVLGEPLPMIPPLNARLALRYDRERWFGEVGWRGVARQDRVPERPDLPPGSPPYCDVEPVADPCRPVPGEFLPTEGYSLLNAGAGYRWFPGHQVHSVALRVENLTDRLYRSHLSRIKELSPEPGIGATLSYRVTF